MSLLCFYAMFLLGLLAVSAIRQVRLRPVVPQRASPAIVLHLCGIILLSTVTTATGLAQDADADFKPLVHVLETKRLAEEREKDCRLPEARSLYLAAGKSLKDLPTGTFTGAGAGVTLPHADRLQVLAVRESVLALPSLAAIKRSDVLICCVDNAPARYAVALLAKLYLKPLLDIGTGVLHGIDRPMGADIRFILPDRCLLCFGGIAGLNSGREDGGGDWRARRAGSLRSLNQIGTGFGLRALELEDWIAGRLRTNSWLQIDFDPSGIPRLTNRELAPEPGCPLCSRGASGDAGLQPNSFP